MIEHIDVPFEIKSEDVQDNGIFDGYGSVFGGKPDSYGDIVTEGAFSESLASGGRNGTGVAMLWQHLSDKVPGAWIMLAENKKGLKVQGQLNLNVQVGKEAYELMKMKPAPAIRGLSIGYNVTDYDVDEKRNIRYLKKIDLWEISLVTFPAQTRAQITGVKSIKEAQNVREMERALRDAGLSWSNAKYIVSLCKKSLRDEEIKKEFDDVITSVKSLNDSINFDLIESELKKINNPIGG